tara:strand:- start:126 stop:626 length:501 start_codon:yes stop_codon:yes gene_type:complete
MVSTMAFAQIQKGDVQITGNVGFNKTETSGGTDVSRVTISPKAGVFLSETTSLGGVLGYTNVKFSGTTTTDLFNVGAYARFHKSVVENFYLYLEPSFIYGFAGSNASNDAVDIKLSPGMTYFMSPKFALDMNYGMIGYNKDSGGTENYGLTLNMSNITLGASFYIR